MSLSVGYGVRAVLLAVSTHSPLQTRVTLGGSRGCRGGLPLLCTPIMQELPHPELADQPQVLGQQQSQGVSP